MAGPPKNHVVEPQSAADPAREMAASLATKGSALPSHLEPRAGQVANGSAPTSQASGRRMGILGWLTYCVVFLITLSLVVVALLRLTYHDGTYFLTCLNAFTRYLYLPAYACLAWAIWKRRWILALVNLAVVCLHITLLAPDFVRDRRFDSTTNSATADTAAVPTVRIFFANVCANNAEYAALLREIQDANPDVIVLVEFTPNWRRAYLQSPFFAGYPYGNGMKNEATGTANVFSRLPLENEKQNWFAGRGLETFEIPVGSETLHVIGVHSPRPMNFRSDDYDGFWKSTIPLIQREKGPLVVVGDCNATQFSSVYQQLTADRLRSAHQDRGRGYAVTWPNGEYGIPSLIRIDQAFLSPEIECLGIKEGEGLGSDHKPLILDIKIHPSR
jgi:endonuclease/exonuclease/phosphatase (EEP) superfamily protein YafD